MQVLFVLTALALGAALTPSASAAPCSTQGSADAKELNFDLKDKETLRGLHDAFRFGLEPKEFPVEDIEKIAMPCSRGTIALTSHNLELFGEDNDLPPRWAVAADVKDAVFFIAAMPKPDAARRWADAGQKGDNGSDHVAFKPEDMMFAVALTTAVDQRMVFHFFTKIPDDTRLKTMFQAIATRKARWLVGFDVDTREVVPNLEP
jgi:hypothetical protein